MAQRWLQVFDKLFLRRPALTLGILLVIIGWLAVHVPNFKLDASADALVLEGDKSLEIFREVNKRYGSEEFLLVTYSPHAPLLSQKVLDRLAALRDDLAELAGVSSVVSILDVPLLYSPPVTLSSFSDGIHYLHDPETDRDLVREELRNSPIYKDLLSSHDGRTTALQVNLTRDPHYHELLKARDDLRTKKKLQHLTKEENAQLRQAELKFRDYATEVNERQRRLVEDVRSVLEPYRQDAAIFLGGVPMIAADMIRFIQSDLLVFGSGIVLFIVLMLVAIFRRLRWVVLPLLTCLITAVGMLGYLTWVDWRMTVISSNFVALLLIITLSISIHLVVRYRELHSDNPDLSQRQLVLDMVGFMARPCLYTALTTMIAFMSLVVSGIRPVIDFGWMMTLGVAVALLLAFIIIPAGMLLLKKTEPAPRKTETAAFTLRFATFTERHGKTILLASTLLAVLSVIGISRLEVENRFIDYFHPSTEIYQGMETIDRALGGTIPLDIVIRHHAREVTSTPFEPHDSKEGAANESKPKAGKSYDELFGDDFEEDDFASDGTEEEQSYWFTRAGLGELERIHNYLDSIDEVGKVLSLATLYKVTRDISGDGVDDIQLALIKKNLSDDIKKVMIDPYLSEEGDETRITLRAMETNRNLHRAELLDNIELFLLDEMGYRSEDVDMTGMLVLYNNMLQSLYRSQILTLVAVFITIMLMFIVLFRSFYIALIAITPNMLAAAIVLGGMGLIGIPLDMMTITIAAITVGIGVDDTIHYIHRFLKEFPKDRNYVATMYRCHGSIGKAMYYTSVTIIVGFSILALSNFTPSIYFGFLTGFAMFSALMGALLLLPKLLITFKPLGSETPRSGV
jgi:hypothetical protein